MLKTVKDACQVHANTLEYQSAEGVEQLSDCVFDEDQGEAFFARNYITSGMEELLNEGMLRLSGQSGQAVFELAQAMGGGKTHLMSALGLIAQNPQHRKGVLTPETLDVIGDETARVAVFEGRNSHPDHLWGTIADQLGDQAVKVLKPLSQSNAAPGKDEWIEALKGQPTLILMDELPPYLEYTATRTMGSGTLADVVNRAVSNLFEAALALPDCCVVLSNLKNSYAKESGSITRVIKNLQSESSRQAKSITPVSLDGDEIYAIIRKRLFAELPDQQDIGEVADAFSEQIQKAEDSGYFNQRSMIQLEDEIHKTYPFHPSFKHIVALFKDNPGFRETRGLLEFSARVVRSVWNRKTNDVYLIGTQHLDLSDTMVSTALDNINRALRNAIARDISDKGSAHAEGIDDDLRSDAGTQVSNLLLSASLSESVQGHVGLHEYELIEYLVDPQRKADEFKQAISQLRQTAWYLHTDASENLFFKDTENLLKRLQSDAEKQPQDRIDDELKRWLTSELESKYSQAYQSVLVMPTLDQISDEIKHSRVLVVAKPDGSAPPEEIENFFESIEHKNNILILTSHDSQLMGEAISRFREMIALERIQKEVSKGSNEAQVREARDLQETTQEAFIQAIQSVFNRIYYPGQSGTLETNVIENGLRFSSRDNPPEKQIEKFLASNRCDQKLILDLESEIDSITSMAEEVLWGGGSKRQPWKDIKMRASSKPEWPWLPGRNGLDQVKSHALSRGIWRQGHDGYVEKGPFEKEKTSVSITTRTTDEDDGGFELQITTRNAGNTPQVHVSKSENVSEKDPLVESLDAFRTSEPMLYFIAVDTEGDHEKGEAARWVAPIKIRHEVYEKPDHRLVKLQSTPNTDMYYTIDGSGPREGKPYTEPFKISDEKTIVQVYACTEGGEATEKFIIQPNSDPEGRVEVDQNQPASLDKADVRIDSTESVFKVLSDFKSKNVEFHQTRVTIGEGESSIEVNFNAQVVTPEILENTIDSIRKAIGETNSLVQMRIRNGGGKFATGSDLKHFAEIAGITLTPDKVSQ